MVGISNHLKFPPLAPSFRKRGDSDFLFLSIISKDKKFFDGEMIYCINCRQATKVL